MFPRTPVVVIRHRVVITRSRLRQPQRLLPLPRCTLHIRQSQQNHNPLHRQVTATGHRHRCIRVRHRTTASKLHHQKTITNNSHSSSTMVCIHLTVATTHRLLLRDRSESPTIQEQKETNPEGVTIIITAITTSRRVVKR